MKSIATTILFLALSSISSWSNAHTGSNTSESADLSKDITIRTESYARPPYSGATYYFYENSNQVVCTKLEVCNKFGDCAIEYKAGKFQEKQDKNPFEKTSLIPIPHEKLGKHRCLTKFGLIK